MHYVALIHGPNAKEPPAEREVEITELAAGRYQLLIDGRRFEVDAEQLGESTLSLICDDEAYDVEFEQAKKGRENALIRGYALSMEVHDLRKMNLLRAQASGTGPKGPVEITSPMPGKVVAVLVKEGQQVEEDQGVVVVEAMKMENELKSPKAGKVTSVTAKEGAAVEGGAILCVIE